MRFAIIGAGAIGTVHARLIDSLPDEATLTAVVDSDLPRATELAARYGARAFAGTAELYAAGLVDAVSVCLPSAWHTDAAVAALEAGLDVIVEKPIAVGLPEADRLIDAERRSGRVVSVISQRRFQPPAAFIKEAIDRGELGRITSGTTESVFFRSQEYYDSGDWRGTLAIDGGGALMNQGIHALDLLIWWLGRPVRVSAHTGQVGHERIEVEDIAAASIVFASGAIGSVLASTSAYPGLPVRVGVHGDQGSAVMDGEELRFFSSRSAGPAPLGPGACQPTGDGPAGWSPIDLAHRAQYRDFIDAVASGRAPLVTTEAGRLALEVVLAVYDSARLGRAVELRGA